MKILIINSGSSSIKYQLMVMPANEVICSGMIDRIGLETSNITFKTVSNSFEEILPVPTHKVGLQKVADMLLDAETGVIKTTSEITAVGHRVVHGGSYFSNTTVITEEVKEKIKELSELAPLHNPAHLVGINVAEEIFASAKQVAVFDTAFHQTIPVEAHKYAIPNFLLTEHKVRVYGFHGTSHKYVSEKAINYLEKGSKIITIHLGNGCSMTAVKDGKSIDTTMGFSPANGLVMGTRAGDIDQSVIFYMVKSLGYTPDEVNSILLKQSGMLGLTGYSDLRDIESKASEGNKDCQLALLMNAYRIRKTIGSYAAALNGLDAIVFTAGIGENSSFMRNLICTDMDYFGIEIDKEKNQIRSKELREINTPNSIVKILVVPTDEEFEIANQVYQLLEN
ncbi:acetate/propionate family kinase [Flavobacterium johnsoniae]|uniref:Acetate kinase n=1 Tax=Flavobacterium johnsoniae (strain ATCC 17061 / DSM 2064 / JCM 8514 / BCRC 14874 / CCUG 350202 / NBRC 14942 / NCIMB 11054 / UW101) TaxID=376686 RepID=ACKA_FLAJ1|nr:acetate kinase [Flavobacterium johnsoniae]A5FE24.1 RecName: Full=Acetate kinase; AltName: Full=Acetokinase [Flavobacterium johnsoniae UW101]ABQ06542.1 acetate kinase [Flavobacterium johnsoniae UW101]OXE99780.1 acetate kinase [Flavobacterium johnsoniae UW101]WQG82294.1 acetate kinase [Flavobacterium johnsoniae UW101]SHK78903.1 acetate kinase [Flavobacterium johnsoniae]